METPKNKNSTSKETINKQVSPVQEEEGKDQSKQVGLIKKKEQKLSTIQENPDLDQPKQKILSTMKIKPQDIFETIEDGFPSREENWEYIFPHPRYWIGPRFLAIWIIPIFVIKKTLHLLTSINPIRAYSKSNFNIKTSETIYTSTKQALDGTNPMIFFGARFLSIWVLPLAILGILMEFLFISPLTGAKPFG